MKQKGRNSFVMYDDWSMLFCNITKEQAGNLIQLIYKYQEEQLKMLK